MAAGARDKKVLFEALCAEGEEDQLETLLREAANRAGYQVRRVESVPA